MATPTHIMAADNYYLPSYDEALRYDEPKEFFSARAITGGALRNKGPYTLDRPIITLVKKVCGKPARCDTY